MPLQGVTFVPGNESELRVSARPFRHYTPITLDSARGELVVLFYTHGSGPGSSWVRALRTGQPAGVLGPGGHFKLREGAMIKRHVFLGDETTLGVFASMEQAATSQVIGAIEVSDQVAEGLSSNVLLTRVGLIARASQRGASLRRWLHDQQLAVDDQTQFYIAGHTASIVELREQLMLCGWSRKQIIGKPYWRMASVDCK